MGHLALDQISGALSTRMTQTKCVFCVLRCAGIEAITKDVEALRVAAQNEMLLTDESSPAAVLDELQSLRSKLAEHSDELERIKKFQRLFKVCCTPRTAQCLPPGMHTFAGSASASQWLPVNAV